MPEKLAGFGNCSYLCAIDNIRLNNKTKTNKSQIQTVHIISES